MSYRHPKKPCIYYRYACWRCTSHGTYSQTRAAARFVARLNRSAR